jgi:hypothetical protein
MWVYKLGKTGKMERNVICFFELLTFSFLLGKKLDEIYVERIWEKISPSCVFCNELD